MVPPFSYHYQITDIKKITLHFSNLFRLLGNTVSLEKDQAGLQIGKHGKFTYEYTDEISRIVFLVASLMPNSDIDPKCNAKKSLISNNFVSIVFNESSKPYKLGTVSGQFDHVAIEVCEILDIFC